SQYRSVSAPPSPQLIHQPDVAVHRPAEQCDVPAIGRRDAEHLAARALPPQRLRLAVQLDAQEAGLAAQGGSSAVESSAVGRPIDAVQERGPLDGDFAVFAGAEIE